MIKIIIILLSIIIIVLSFVFNSIKNNKKIDDEKIDDEKIDDEKIDDKKIDDEKIDDEKIDNEKENKIEKNEIKNKNPNEYNYQNIENNNIDIFRETEEILIKELIDDVIIADIKYRKRLEEIENEERKYKETNKLDYEEEHSEYNLDVEYNLIFDDIYSGLDRFADPEAEIIQNILGNSKTDNNKVEIDFPKKDLKDSKSHSYSILGLDDINNIDLEEKENISNQIEYKDAKINDNEIKTKWIDLSENFDTYIDNMDLIHETYEEYLLCENNIMRDSSGEIEEIIKNRNIFNLIHFTRIDNLESILNEGILSVKLIEDHNIQANINDRNRFDGRKDMISLSVEFPNYKMLYKLRNNFKNKWVIISVEPKILYEKDRDILFCKHNAASTSMSQEKGEVLRSISAFESMFEDINYLKENQILREELNIPKNYTTDPQAEILIGGHISKEYIQCIYFETWDDYYYARDLVGKELDYYDIEVSKAMFGPRIDYQYW